ncbi:MAG: hypothetical protein ACRELY_18210 [Polyangiaceae bacterium]
MKAKMKTWQDAHKLVRYSFGCSLVVLVAACSGTATPSGFSSGDDSSGGGGGDDSSGGGGGGGGGKDGGGGVVPPASTQLQQSVDVTQINVYQATEVVIVSGSKAASHQTPVVAGRPGLFRVFVSPHSGFSGNVTAQLRFEDGSGKALDQLSQSQSVSAASSENDPSTTINFDVPAADLPSGGKLSVALVDTSAADVPSGTASTSRYPQDGSSDPTTAKDTGPLKITLVPTIVSGGYAPDTSSAQLQILHDTMFGIYPVTDVQITVHAQESAPYTVAATNSSGFENVLEWGTSLRESENPPADVYYWITFDPKSSFNSFCGGGCIAGLSTVADVNDPSGRVSTGLGYTGSDTAFTMAHEVGHAHGRDHAPGCGASGIDPSFPSSYIENSSQVGQFGSIGVIGYDIVGKQFIDPSQTGDMMGYCPPTWVSDYTYRALATRVATLNGAADMIGSPLKFATPQAHRFVNIDGSGNVTWGQAINMRDKPQPGDHTVTYLDAKGNVMMSVTAQLHKLDHAEGGFLIVPEGPAGFASIKVTTNAGTVHAERTLVKNY